MTFRTETLVVARKPHQCDAGCRQPIVPGERYVRHVGVWDGDFYSARMHEDCGKLADNLRDCFDPYDEGMPWSLVECFAGAGLSPREREEIFSEHRGYFPRAVCRLELAMRKWSDA